MLTFPTIDPDAQRVLTFDCTADLSAGEVLSGGAMLKSLRCTAGNDQSPDNILVASITYDPTSTMILQPVSNMSALDGNDYEFEVASGTSFGDKIIVVRALLQIRSD